MSEDPGAPESHSAPIHKLDRILVAVTAIFLIVLVVLVLKNLPDRDAAFRAQQQTTPAR
jgi:hypothetical protein